MTQPQASFGGLFSVVLLYLCIPTEPFKLSRSVAYDADENWDMDYDAPESTSAANPRWVSLMSAVLLTR